MLLQTSVYTEVLHNSSYDAYGIYWVCWGRVSCYFSLYNPTRKLQTLLEGSRQRIVATIFKAQTVPGYMHTAPVNTKSDRIYYKEELQNVNTYSKGSKIFK